MEQNAVWQALADPHRRKLLDLLRMGPKTTGELCTAFRVSRFAVMKHLTVLENAGLLVTERRGRERWNHLNSVPIRRIYERWISPYQEQWAGKLLRLEAHITGKDEAMQAVQEATGVRAISIAAQSELDAPSERVFEALTKDIGAWWGAPFLYSAGDAKDVTLDPRPGGYMMEHWGNGSGAIWCTVSEVKAPVKLILLGSMGMPGAVVGKIRFELSGEGGRTVVKLIHDVIGQISPQIEQGYTQGWQDLVGRRLKNFVEKGERPGIRT